MQAITVIGLDIAKSAFQVHGVDAQGSRTDLLRSDDSPCQPGAVHTWPRVVRYDAVISPELGAEPTCHRRGSTAAFDP
jgi:hypothetical protein